MLAFARVEGGGGRVATYGYIFTIMLYHDVFAFVCRAATVVARSESIHAPRGRKFARYFILRFRTILPTSTCDDHSYCTNVKVYEFTDTHTQMKRRGLTPDGQTLEGLISGASKSQEEFDKVEAEKVVVSRCWSTLDGAETRLDKDKDKPDD